MSLTYGFYNSIDHDRLYNAGDFSSIFDGIIKDGVFATYGDALMVKAADEGFTVNVSIGRAWFNHTWTLNDAILPIEGFESELTFDRIDAVVLEVDRSVAVRANSIKMVKGPVGAEPTKPTLIHSETVDQYALAYINVQRGATSINQANIENAIGTMETPFVTGLLETIDASDLYDQWQTEFENQINADGVQFDEWFAQKKREFLEWFGLRDEEYTEWSGTKKTDFENWFANIQYTLDGDAAGHLQNQIDTIVNTDWYAHGKLNAGETAITIADERITENSIIEVFYMAPIGVRMAPLSYNFMTISAGEVMLEFNALPDDLDIYVRIL